SRTRHGPARAAGWVSFAIGTETCGSIISPSTANGVVGLRPTYGRVSRYGAMGLSNTMDKAGPMCRYVEDCVLVLNAIYGPDKRDGTVADAGFPWNPDAPLSGYKIAYVRSGFEPTAADARGGGAPGAGGGAAGGAGAAGGGRGGPGGGRGGMSVEERRKVYGDVLNAYRKLGAHLTP